MVDYVVFPFILAQCCPFLVSPISRPGHIPKDPHLSLRGIHSVLPYHRSRVYAPRPSLSLSVPHRVLLSDLMPALNASFSLDFLLALEPLVSPWCFCMFLPICLLYKCILYVMWWPVTYAVIFTLTSLTEGRSARDLPEQHPAKERWCAI